MMVDSDCCLQSLYISQQHRIHAVGSTGWMVGLGGGGGSTGWIVGSVVAWWGCVGSLFGWWVSGSVVVGSGWVIGSVVQWAHLVGWWAQWLDGGALQDGNEMDDSLWTIEELGWSAGGLY